MSKKIANSLMIPSDPGAEQAVLGSALIDPDAAMRLCSLIEAGDFFTERNQWIYAAICELSHEGAPVDYVSLSDRLDRNGKLDEVGGMAYLADITNQTPTSIYIDHYASIVKRHAQVRRYISFASSLMEMAYGAHTPEDLFAFIEENKRALQPAAREGASQTWEESFTHYWQVLEERAAQSATGGRPSTYPWQSWNNMIDPAEPGLPILISGDTGTGKTVFLEVLADWWAMQGINVNFAHFELNRAIMGDRRMVRHSGVSRSKLASGILTPEEEKRVRDAENRLLNWKGQITYTHCPGWSMDQLAVEVGDNHDKGLCDALVMDYLDKCEPSPRQRREFGNHLQHRIGNDTEVFKSLVESRSIYSVTAAQLNKEGKKATFAGLSKADIANSSERIDKVNVIALIYRAAANVDEYNERGDLVANAGDPSRHVMVKIDKNTLGQRGVLDMIMAPERFDVRDAVIERVPLTR